MKNAKNQLKNKIQEFFEEKRWIDAVSDNPPKKHKISLNSELLIELYKSKFPVSNLHTKETTISL